VTRRPDSTGLAVEDHHVPGPLLREVNVIIDGGTYAGTGSVTDTCESGRRNGGWQLVRDCVWTPTVRPRLR
jgi:hypothetical protein